MKQVVKTALLILILIFVSNTNSIAQDSITRYDGVTISGDIVSIDSIEIKLKFLPKNRVGWILRTFEVKKIKKISYNDSEYNLDKINIEKLIDIFNTKECSKDSKPQIIFKDQSLIV
ncbi:MAG: hypothetical protein ACOCXH_04985 [Cyclobacteriaceae bacterium]